MWDSGYKDYSNGGHWALFPCTSSADGTQFYVSSFIWKKKFVRAFDRLKELCKIKSNDIF
jgi:hypothetical protein